MIDETFLEEQIAFMRQAIAGYQGAIEFAEMCLARLRDGPGQAMTVDEFADMIGGEGSTVEIIPNGHE